MQWKLIIKHLPNSSLVYGISTFSFNHFLSWIHHTSVWGISFTVFFMALNSDRMCQKGSNLLGSLWFWTRTFADRDMSTFDFQTCRTSFLVSDLHSNGGRFHALKCGILEWPHHHVMWVEWSLDFFLSVCVLHNGVTWSTLSLTFPSQSFIFFLNSNTNL